MSVTLFFETPAHSYQRHCNVDGVVVQALNSIEVEVIISYDIACQWGIHFWERMAEFPNDAHLKLTKDALIMRVPKFHLWAYKPQCHARFSFNYLCGCGQTHGETIEENWADSNKASAQTKMMGPGARQDTLDNIFGFHNYRIMENFSVYATPSPFHPLISVLRPCSCKLHGASY